VDGAYEEAARTSGASRLQVVTRVTLPLVMPSLVAAGAFSLIISWGLFATPAILGIPSRIYVFATQLYLFLQSFPPRLEVSAAMGMLFCLSALLLGLGAWALRRRWAGRTFAVMAGQGRRPALLPLGRGRLWAAAACWGISCLAVFLPAAMVLYMSLNTSWFGAPSLANTSLANYAYVLTGYPNTAVVIGNSLSLAAMEAGLALSLGLAVAYLLARTRWRPRRALAGAASYTVLIPSVAFLTGVIWAWIKAPLPLYGTLALIALAQAARSMPVVCRNLGDGFGQIHLALEEAAVTCGSGRLRTFLRVSLPLLRPVLLGSFTIVFLSSLRDLNTPLFLGAGSTETLTLSVLIFQFWSESRAGESAALTILLLLLTLGIFLPIHRLVPRAE
jgi:iron(III) transport system permease protein